MNRGVERSDLMRKSKKRPSMLKKDYMAKLQIGKDIVVREGFHARRMLRRRSGKKIGCEGEEKRI